MARIAPDAADVPVFPSYDLERQFRVIADVGRLSAVPVPQLFWCEHDHSTSARRSSSWAEWRAWCRPI